MLSSVVSVKTNAVYVLHSGKIIKLIVWLCNILNKDEAYVPAFVTTLIRCLLDGFDRQEWNPSAHQLKDDVFGLLVFHSPVPSFH